MQLKAHTINISRYFDDFAGRAVIPTRNDALPKLIFDFTL